jgi:hypothetical protein
MSTTTTTTEASSSVIESSKGVKAALSNKAEELQIGFQLKLSELQDEFKAILEMNGPVAVQELAALALRTVAQLGKVTIHYVAAATIGLAKLIKGFANLLFSIAYVTISLLVRAGQKISKETVNLFRAIRRWAESLMRRDGKAQESDVVKAEEINSQLVTVTDKK